MYKANEVKYIEEWAIKRKPTSAILWSDIENSSPIEDLRSWQKDLGDICGVFGNVIEFNNKTFSYMTESWECDRLGYMKIVVPSDLIDPLWSNVQPEINEDLDDGKVIIKVSAEYLPSWYKDLEATVL